MMDWLFKKKDEDNPDDLINSEPILNSGESDDLIRSEPLLNPTTNSMLYHPDNAKLTEPVRRELEVETSPDCPYSSMSACNCPMRDEFWQKKPVKRRIRVAKADVWNGGRPVEYEVGGDEYREKWNMGGGDSRGNF